MFGYAMPVRPACGAEPERAVNGQHYDGADGRADQAGDFDIKISFEDQCEDGAADERANEAGDEQLPGSGSFGLCQPRSWR